MADLVYDSWWAPTDADLAVAKQRGVKAWWLYFALQAGDRIYRGSADADFQRILAAGLETGAFCSGDDDPVACKARAVRLGIPINLDVEGSIRDDGPWVDPWLAASGAGLYGNETTIRAHLTHPHPAFVVAMYPGSAPNEDWPPGLHVPSVRHGWQQSGTTVNGRNADVSHYSAGWGVANTPPPPPPTPPQEFDVANLTKISGSVYIGADGRGYWDLPAGVVNVVNVVVYTQDPQTLGHYAAVPGFAGVAWPPGKPGRLVFGTGPDGRAPSAGYGFDVWYVG